jgi:ubiquinone/menaquinone biosynthesis C-methylase UbiE
MKTLDPKIREHNVEVGARWSAGGKAYEEISMQISDSLQHAVDRLDPEPGESVLDLATGTGWTARLLAARGALTTGVDIAAEQIAAARELSDGAIDFQVGDAEALPFADGEFDAVVSTAGIQFVTKPEDAAAELARVLRVGGRFVITLWERQSSVAEMFKIFSRHTPGQLDSAVPSPFEWGTRERVVELLGDAFEIEIENAVSYYRANDAEDTWRAFSQSYGPSKSLVSSLDAEGRKFLKADFVELYRNYQTEVGLQCQREYLLVRGWKR